MKYYEPINVGSLENDERIKTGGSITKEVLTQLGYLRKVTSLVKILGNGDLKKKLLFEDMDAVSATALKKIEVAGGEIKLSA